MEIEIISKESIKPSSPTPHHLKTFELSLLDQLVVDPYVPIVLYYPNHNGSNVLQALERSLALKKSLSKTLTQFYPLAGTIKNGLSIDCNDVGACYAIALVRCGLNELLSHPDHQLLNGLLPFQPSFEGSSVGARVTNVQVNIFECGGIAIGLCISHRIVDGAALRTFLEGWTNMACGAKEVVYPNLAAPSLFPAKDSWLRDSSMAMCGSWLKEGKCVTKRFVFDSDSIARLKAEATKNGVKNPTRVEVVSALIWKSAMAASKQITGFQKPSRLTHLVNLRRKLSATLSKDSIGNVIWPATAKFQANYETTLHGLVNKVRESISKIDIEFVNKAQGEKGCVAMQESIKEMGEISSKGTMDNYTFTSWCKMGFYQMDFGWGVPSWVSGIIGHGSPVFINQVTLMDTVFGEGIEAWVNLDEEEMEILQGNSELQAYASMDPSPLPKLTE
ncbi:vinorine synthase-like [Cynara cardunculus var. scolymus]|uniref:Chloramphenicol acetyltransferase-like domain-containing protein n=1 Tax=Cynara cardunculus var. scolymus TaxID=59895 RepID=A0A118I5B6_CYNCS|nr:vinorine synthase-like [Cynara cardunculus var. scolymus]KVG85968.1 Chloramphenicol acetyltransferase-like domain-containing protein [Cynara cardunculus var. scolymus]